MNPYFEAIIYAALHQRVKCSHCGAMDHHKRLGSSRFFCNNCRKEFKLYQKEKY